MYKIVDIRPLNESATVFSMEVEAPNAARKCQAGQFVIVRLDEYGERLPFTIAGWNRETGTVTIIFQVVGKSSQMLSQLQSGDFIADLAGPLGKASHWEGVKRAVVVGGGTGCAIAYPIAREMHKGGVTVDMIAGFRSKDIVMMEDDMREACTNLYMMTDDGSYGEKGFTTQKLQELLESDNQYDLVIAIGPIIMMKLIAGVTKPFGVKTVASVNPIMVDGTGMCGACRLTVDGETKFACVEGPEFDAQLIDWDELMKRNSFYSEEEKESSDHVCRLTGGVRHG